MAAFDTAPFVAKGGPAALAVLMRLLETLRDKGVLTSDECKQILGCGPGPFTAPQRGCSDDEARFGGAYEAVLDALPAHRLGLSLFFAASQTAATPM